MSLFLISAPMSLDRGVCRLACLRVFVLRLRAVRAPHVRAGSPRRLRGLCWLVLRYQL